MVRIPVQDQHTLTLRDKSGRSDGDIVEEAKTHRSVWSSVMSRRTQCEKCRIGLTASQTTNGVQSRSRRGPRRKHRSVAGRGIRIECEARGTCALDEIEVPLGMHTQQLLISCRSRAELDEIARKIGRYRTLEHRAKSRRTLRMTYT